MTWFSSMLFIFLVSIAKQCVKRTDKMLFKNHKDELRSTFIINNGQNLRSSAIKQNKNKKLIASKANFAAVESGNTVLRFNKKRAAGVHSPINSGKTLLTHL